VGTEKEKTHLEVAHRHDLFNPDLEHLHNLSGETPDPDETMRTLLGVRSDDEERGVVLGAPEIQRGSVFERANGVVGFRESDGVGLLELVLFGGTTGTAEEDSRAVGKRAGRRGRRGI
jgi:hypothetical protein